MFIIYNKDGSIKTKNFAEFIQKGNNFANFIFVGIDGLDLTDYTCYATFELPTEELGGPVAGVPIVEFSEELPYSGYNIPVTAEMTQYEGQVKLSLHIENSQGAEMYTYPVILVINDATSAPDQTKITLSQYQALLNLVNSKPVPTSNLFFTVVDDLSLIPDSEWELYNEGKIFYDKQTQKFYEKDGQGAANVINLEDKTFSIGINDFDENGEYELNSNELEKFEKCYLIDLYQIGPGVNRYHYYLLKSKYIRTGRPPRPVSESEICIQITNPFNQSYDGYPTIYTLTRQNYDLTLTEERATDFIVLNISSDHRSGTFADDELEVIKKPNSKIIAKIGNSYSILYLNQNDESSNELTFFSVPYYYKETDYIEYSQEKITVDVPSRDWYYDELIDYQIPSKTYVDYLITGAVRFKGTVADLTALNAIQNPSQGDMYWVTSENSYYIWNGSAWSQTGGTVDLSDYYNKTESAQTFVDFIHDQTISGVKTFANGIKIEDSTVGCYSQIVPGANSLDFYFKETSGTLEKLFSLYAHVQTGQTTTYHAIFDTDTVRPSYDNFSSLGETDHRWKNLYLSGNLVNGNRSVSVSEIYNVVHAGVGHSIVTISSGISGIITNGTFTQEQKDLIDANDNTLIEVIDNVSHHYFFRKGNSYGGNKFFYCESDDPNGKKIYKLYAPNNVLTWEITVYKEVIKSYRHTIKLTSLVSPSLSFYFEAINNDSTPLSLTGVVSPTEHSLAIFNSTGNPNLSSNLKIHFTSSNSAGANYMGIVSQFSLGNPLVHFLHLRTLHLKSDFTFESESLGALGASISLTDTVEEI